MKTLNIVLTALSLIPTLVSFGQGKEPAEKIEKKQNPNWDSEFNNWNYFEDGKQIHFIKANVAKLETCSDGLDSFLSSYLAVNETVKNKKETVSLAKKFYLGATILKTKEDTIGDYVKLVDISENDKFIVVGTKLIIPKYYIVKSSKREKESPFSSKKEVYYVTDSKAPYYPGNDEYYVTTKYSTKVMMQNMTTKLYYVINLATFEFSYQSCENLKYDTLAQIYKTIPKALSSKEVELLKRYKALIKSANVNCVYLQDIQKKYLTRGYFDAARVKGIDKQNYNKNLEILKVKAVELAHIGRYEDKDSKAVDKLTIEEISSLDKINNWNMNVFPIN